MYSRAPCNGYKYEKHRTIFFHNIIINIFTSLYAKQFATAYILHSLYCKRGCRESPSFEILNYFLHYEFPFWKVPTKCKESKLPLWTNHVKCSYQCGRLRKQSQIEEIILLLSRPWIGTLPNSQSITIDFIIDKSQSTKVKPLKGFLLFRRKLYLYISYKFHGINLGLIFDYMLS